MIDSGGKNTDIEIWRGVEEDFYSPSIHVTEQGEIGINVAGTVLVASVEEWHSAGLESFGTKMESKKIEPLDGGGCAVN